MNTRAVFLSALMATSFSAAAAQVSQQGASQHFSYANIAWGSSAEKVKALVAAQGLTFVKKDADGDLEFKGTLMDQSVGVFGIMAHDSLVKIAIVFLTPDNKARSFYHEMLGVLTQKYGEPRGKIEQFSEPYYDGDGFEDQAIRLGKAFFVATWGADEDKTETMWLNISEQLNVVLSYESPAFAVEAKLRKDKKARAF